MATAREIRRRIRSVRNVAQITRALQLVASSKMRRTRERALLARPYADELRQLLARLAAAVPGEEEGDEVVDLRLLDPHAAIHTLGIVLVTPDRTLSGALSSNTSRRALTFVEEQRRALGVPGLPVKFVAVGRRGRDFLVRNRLPLLAEFTNLGDVPDLGTVRAIARVVTDAYLANEVDAWHLVYPRFVSTLIQTPSLIALLPVQPPVQEPPLKPIDYIYEPSAAAIYAALLPRYVETMLYQPILESVASFYAAQFVAMRSATDNATDLAEDLNLTYNKARQAAITTQILEVVAGAGEH
jgi:F-type H+-transporting ATPase subunit gamma